MSADDLLAWAHANDLAIAAFAPLVGAALALLAPGRFSAWLVATMAAGAAFAAAAWAAGDALFFARDGGVYRDGVAAFAAPLLAFNLLAATLGAGYLLRDMNPRAAPFALALALAIGGGWAGALLSNTLVEMFLAVEAASIACVALAALAGDRDRSALNGALKMFGASGAAAALMLLGVGLIERGAGVARLHDLPLAQIGSPDMALLGTVLVLAGLAWKAGLAPLNTWGGGVFGRGGHLAPMLIGAVHAVGALAVMVRIAAYASQAPAIGAGVAAALAGLGIVGLLAGSVQAIGATNFQRLAAFCVTAHAGGVLIAAALGSNAGFSAAFVQLFALTGTACALFCAGATAPGATSGAGFEGMEGLVRRAPLAAVALLLAALSAMGAPMTIGFLSRWRLMEAGIGAGWWWTIPAAVAASLAGVFYGGKLIERMFLRRAAMVATERRDFWRIALVPGIAAGIAAISLAAAPQLLLRGAATAADIVLRGAP